MIGATATAGVPVAWLVARAAGLTALALLSASVWLGLSMSVRLFPPGRQKEIMAWHQTVMWCAIAMVGLHGAALLLDPLMHFPVSRPGGLSRSRRVSSRRGSCSRSHSRSTCAGD
jgi:hypothetical protein